MAISALKDKLRNGGNTTQIQSNAMQSISMLNDELFGVSNNTNKNNIVQLSFDLLFFYQDQKYRMYDEYQRNSMVDDIIINGVLSPIVVRPVNGKYEILAGRNRMTCAQLAGLSEMPCIIKEVDDAHAKLIVNSTNLCQRQNLLPSEKAYGYKQQYEALIEIGGDTAKRPTALMSEKTGENRKTIQRYIKLAEIHSSLLQLVDEKRIQVNSGVILTAICTRNQEHLSKYLYSNKNIKINDKKANELILLEQEHDFYPDILDEFFKKKDKLLSDKKESECTSACDYSDEEVLNDSQAEQYISISSKKLLKYIPKGQDPQEHILKALQFYHESKEGKDEFN